jgi:hypothetical protein
MANYRESRNLEASTIQRIETILTDNNYSGVEVVKTLSKAYDTTLPVICVRVGDTIHSGAELGTHLTQRKPLILIDVFANSDGQKLDLKDLLISGLKSGFVYYNYVIVDGAVSTKTADGRVVIESIIDTPVDLGVNKSDLDLHDRYRWLISLHCSKTKLED